MKKDITGYDIIGDIHGMASDLEALLESMNYRCIKGVWQHPERKAVFVGDYIDKGDQQLKVYRIVRPMIDEGHAHGIMGNHELNAIAFYMPGENGGHLRDRNKPSNQEQHQAFLNEVPVDSEKHKEIIEWLLTLPLWLELEGIRVIHACWDDDHISTLKPLVDSQNRLPSHLIGAATTGESNSYKSDGSKNPENPVFQAAETLLKGIEIKLPGGVEFEDKYGKPRRSSRIAWWNGEGQTYKQAALVEDKTRSQLPDDFLPANVAKGYNHEKPLFIGHYWAKGTPRVLTSKVACVDYSACSGGELVAYRWSGEKELKDSNFHSTSQIEIQQ